MFVTKEARVIESWWKHNNLPNELWLEILSRIPVKSLVRFMCVSKSWQSMVNDPNLCRLHLNNFENNCQETDLFVAQRSFNGMDKEEYMIRSIDTFEPKVTLSSLDIVRRSQEWSVVCSIDGLVMMQYYTPTHELMLWNPSIRRARTLPPSPVVISEGMKNIHLGFGYSPLANEYKLVRLVRQGKRNLHSVAVYTVGTGLWKTVKFNGKGISDWCWDLDSHFRKTVCFRGILYFIGSHSYHDEELVSFDLSNEVFASTAVPTAYTTLNREFNFMGITLVHGGCSLGLVYLYPTEGCIWVSESNAAADMDFIRWTKLYMFITCVPHLGGCFCECICMTPEFLYLGKNGDVLLQWISNWVTSCSLDTSQEKTLLKNRHLDMSMVCGYIESLVLLNG